MIALEQFQKLACRKDNLRKGVFSFEQTSFFVFLSLTFYSRILIFRILLTFNFFSFWIFSGCLLHRKKFATFPLHALSRSLLRRSGGASSATSSGDLRSKRYMGFPY